MDRAAVTQVRAPMAHKTPGNGTCAATKAAQQLSQQIITPASNNKNTIQPGMVGAEQSQFRAGHAPCASRDGEQIQPSLADKKAKPERNRQMSNIATVYKETALHYDISIMEMKSKRRAKGSVRARHVAWHIAYTMLGLSYPDIARTAGRDHTSVMHGVKKIKTLLETDCDLMDEVWAIENKIKLSSTVSKKQARAFDAIIRNQTAEFKKRVTCEFEKALG